MNLCIVSFEAVFLAVLVQFHYINEVEAEKQSYVSVGNWFSSIEKNVNNVPYKEEPEESRQVVLEKQKAPKIKRRIVRKYKKKNMGKRGQREHLPHEQRLDLSVEKDKAKSAKRIMRKNHKKREKERINQRKFVKTLPKESNSSESDEVKRRQPVDIIVHIKMND